MASDAAVRTMVLILLGSGGRLQHNTELRIFSVLLRRCSDSWRNCETRKKSSRAQGQAFVWTLLKLEGIRFGNGLAASSVTELQGTCSQGYHVGIDALGSIEPNR